MTVQIVFIVLFVVIGIIFLYGSITARLKAKAALEWPAVIGNILESEVVEDRARSSTGKATIAYVPWLTYEYSVNGEKYTGHKVAFGSMTYDYLTASKICAKFPVGAQPEVTYNPQKPTEAVLAPRSREGLRSVIPGVFFILVAVVVGIISILYR